MSSHYGGSHYAGSHKLSSHYGRRLEVPDVPHPPGVSEDAEARWRRIMLEDELLLLVIKIWLDVKDH